MVGVVVAVAAVDGFYRATGLERPPLPPPMDGPAHGRHPAVESATLNWVPVAAPADRVAAVVQGLSAAPPEWDNVARLSAAQYIPVDEMGELAWTTRHAQPRRDRTRRGATLRRPRMLLLNDFPHDDAPCEHRS